MYAKLVSLVGTGKVLCTQGLVLYARLFGTGKDFMFCKPSWSAWLVQVRSSCYVCQAGQPGWYR